MPLTRFKLRFLMSLFLCLPLSAQESGTDSIRISRHSLSFGFGLVPENKRFVNDLFAKGTFGDLYYLSHFSFGNMRTTGALNINYTLNVNKRFSFACFASLQSDSKKLYQNNSKEEVGHAQESFVALTPSIYLFWYNRHVFRIYSRCGVSIGYNRSKYKLNNAETSERETEWKPQLTLIGFQAGRRFFGFGEANLGGRHGYLNVGMGYRFGNSKKYR